MPRQEEGGFTLVETVIAMLVMAIAVVSIVGALATMLTFTQEHRQHAVAETSTRSAAQFLSATLAGTELRDAVTAGDTVMPVVDASRILPEGSGPPTTADNSQTYVQIGPEVMRVTQRDLEANALTVERRVGWDSTLATMGHAADTRVLPMFRCPTGAQLEATLPSDALLAGASLDVPESGVVHWKPGGSAGSFVNRSDCLADYNVRCPPPDASPKCGYGLLRARATVATSDDPRLNSRETVILLRQGSL